MSNWKNVAAWEPILVPGREKPWAERLDAVLDDLDVVRAIRYDPQPKTKCNIYVTDVIRNMRVPAPEHWMTSEGVPAKMGQGIEMSANRLAPWFRLHGPRYGWWSADEATARNAAERGHLVVVSWQSDGRREPGHIAIVLGELDGKPRITQAGGFNSRECPLSAGFGNRGPLEFWIQAERVE
jgi:hypothetical protein